MSASEYISTSSLTGLGIGCQECRGIGRLNDARWVAGLQIIPWRLLGCPNFGRCHYVARNRTMMASDSKIWMMQARGSFREIFMMVFPVFEILTALSDSFTHAFDQFLVCCRIFSPHMLDVVWQIIGDVNLSRLEAPVVAGIAFPNHSR